MNDKVILQRQIDSLTREVARLSTKSLQPLSMPIDPTSKKIIYDILPIPVSTRLKNTDPATAANYGVFFVADRAYVFVSAAQTHGTKGTDAGAVTLQIERLQGTEALNSGDEILKTAFDLKGTINTTQYGEPKTDGTNQIFKGDRLALKDAGTLTDVANLAVTVYLKPI